MPGRFKHTMPFSLHSVWRSKPIRVLGVTVAVLVGTLALGEIAGWPFLRTPLARQLSKLIGSTVSLDGDFRAQLLLQPGIAVTRITVGSASAVQVPHLLQADGFFVRWRWTDLWHSGQGAPLRLKLLEADQIHAHLVRLENGEASWAIAKPKTDTSAASSNLPQVEILVLRSGTVVYRDEPLKINLQPRIMQNTDDATELPWRAAATGNYRGVAVDLTAQAARNLPVFLQSPGGNALTPLRLRGHFGSTKLEFDGATGALWAGQAMRGKLSVRGASLRSSGAPLGLTLPHTPPFNIQGRVARRGGVWSLVADEATVGSGALTAAVQLNSATQPPTSTGLVGGRRLAFAELCPSIGAVKAPRETARVLPDEAFDLPSLAQMNADVQVNLAQVDFVHAQHHAVH